MKIKNKYLQGVLQLMQRMTITNVKDSRLRNRFIRQVAEYGVSTYEKERLETIDLFAQKDINGKLKSDENGIVIFTKEDERKCLNELEILDNDFLIIDENEQNKEMLLTVSRLVFADAVIPPLSGEVSVAHDILCDEAEKVIEYYKSQDNSN